MVLEDGWKLEVDFQCVLFEMNVLRLRTVLTVRSNERTVKEAVECILTVQKFCCD